ncbi:EAL domain-containing protein [Endothiovibrio diazotrophicus]
MPHLRAYRDCSLFRQLVVPILLVGLAGVLATTLSARALVASVAAFDGVYRAGDERMRELEELDRSLAHYRALVLRHLASESAARMAAVGDQLAQSRRRIFAALRSAQATSPGASRGQAERLAAELTHYFAEMDAVVRLSADFEKESAFTLLTNTENDHVASITESARRLMREELTEITSTRDALAASATRNLWITVGLGVGGGALVLVIAFGVIRRITGRLSRLLEWSRDVAAGDLGATLEVDAGDEVGRLTAAMGEMARNIAHAHRELADAKREAETVADKLRIYANAFENSGEAILISDRDNCIIDVNSAFAAQTGYTLEEVRGQDPRILSSGRTPRETYQELWASLQEEGFWQGELWDRKKDGQVYPKWTAISAIRDAAGEARFYVASFTDISERKAAEERIAHLAHHDILTGLLNRFSLEDRLEQVLAGARREGREVVVLFIDLDRFKHINDSLGHQVGDQLLVEVASRLRGCVRESDIVARIGGDEFVLVLTGFTESAYAAHVAEKILQRVSEPYRIADHELETTPSIGIAVFPSDGANADELLKSADVAMYHAKERGRHNYYFFTESMRVAATERLALEHALRVAVEEGQLELHYQPQIHVGEVRICAVEALVRWRHPEQGLIPPDRFIPLAEESGVILPLGAWVLDRACAELARWKAAGIGGVRMAVNLSARQLQSEGLVDQVSAAMLAHGLEGSELELEITETAAMSDAELAVAQLTALRRLGVRLAIDDFGTGYSSLAYLKRLPIQTLKLDRTFVRDLEQDNNDAEICAATVALAHNLGLEVVAEGVETEAQQAFLTELGCDCLQGYRFSRPLPAEEAERFIAECRLSVATSR